MSERMKRAVDCWGILPPFVEAIVKACEAKGSSQNKVARQLGYTAAVISQVIANKYPGDMAGIEQKTRMILLGSTVDCPALGNIPELSCVDWRNEAAALTSSSPTVVRMFRACRGCDRYTGDAK